MLSQSVVRWRDLVVYGTPGEGRPYILEDLDGWEGRAAVRTNLPERAAGHGTFDVPLFSGERVVRLAGYCSDPDQRDALFVALDEQLGYGEDAEELAVSFAGRDLTARARLTAFAPTRKAWGSGRFGFAIEWRCADPLRYGAPVSATASFPQRTGGLVWPLFPGGVLDWGPISTSNRLTLTNPGTAPAPVQHEVLGPVEPAGFEIVETGSGRRLVYEAAVAAGSRVLLDGATGQVLLDGVADRGDVLTVREWTPIPKAGGSLEFAFNPRGGTSAAQLTSTVLPAYW